MISFQRLVDALDQSSEPDGVEGKQKRVGNYGKRHDVGRLGYHRQVDDQDCEGIFTP